LKLVRISITVVIIVLFGQFVWAYSDASVFLGPPAGETITLEVYEDTYRNKTCVHVSDDGVYHVEERERLAPSRVPKRYIGKSNIPPEVVQVIKGKKDFVNRYTLQAQDGKLILTSLNWAGKKSILIDFTSDEWINYRASLKGRTKMVSHIVKRETRTLLGKSRKLLFIETSYGADGDGRKELDVFAEGLGLIRKERLNSNAPIVLFSIEGY